MQCSSRSIVRYLGAALAAALVLVVASCATSEGSGSGGPSGPTVKVVLDSQPAAVILINGTDLGTTPITVNIEVDESGFLMYPVSIVWDYAKAGGARNTKTSTQKWAVGKNPPAKISYLNGILSESREAAPRNPPGTKRSFERFD
ncbi:MAG: hypothetical protein RL324_2164 [Verrucomicrobiota bacterium]|jgi:hypothetical protein